MSWTVPALADCAPGIEPVEYQVLVALAEFSEKTAGGILLTEETRDREAFKAATARLVAVSPLAFTYAREEQWQGQAPRVGDVVFVGKYPGDEVEGADGRVYRLCADRQIGAVMERGEAPPVFFSEEPALDLSTFGKPGAFERAVTQTTASRQAMREAIAQARAEHLAENG